MACGAKASSSVLGNWMPPAEPRIADVRHAFLLSLLRKLVLLPSYVLVLLVRLIKWLIAPPALLLQLVIGVPVALKRIRQPLQAHFIPLAEVDLSNAAWITMIDATEDLSAEGFVASGDFRCDDWVQGAVLWLRLLNPPDKTMSALAAHVEIKGSARPMRQFVQFSTEFDDGRVLTTNNFDLPYSLPAPSYLARVQLKDIWDPRALLVLHRGLVASLGKSVNRDKLAQAVHAPARFLAENYQREIQALIESGWLKPTSYQRQVRLRLWAAVVGVWRQAWPLAILHLRAADRHSRRLLAKHGLDAEDFAGGATTIVVSRQALPATVKTLEAFSGYEQIRSLASQTDPRAVLEAIVVELDERTDHPLLPQELRYSFRSYEDHPQRWVRRLCSFDILLDPAAGTLAVTAMERECEQAADEAAWARLTASSPITPLPLSPWLRDLDRILPTARTALLAERPGLGHPRLDSASLYLDHGIPCWQVVAWIDQDIPLVVVLDARSGTIVKHSS
ncbi:hypothetical protein BN873_350073 [Candidatus Competibacter denitrificans Run_A_D11]|uniref:Uncharacterized protein n=2 Tax=Candidatus Competibacter TaxID=221279 RepID=W6M4Z4_9GAMM|nr:hypothetical protein BN873_350073 [Candidatus Competibacter denitrificans Run_A_D11]